MSIQDLTILLVDEDSVSDSETHRALSSLSAVELHTAHTLCEVQKEIRTTTFNIAIINLPTQDALAMLAELRSTLPQVPTVVAFEDGSMSSEERLEVVRNGAEDVIAISALSASDALDRLSFAIARHRSQLELERNRDAFRVQLRAREDLLANVSHELRSPVHVIRGMAETALHIDGQDKQKECLHTILESTYALSEAAHVLQNAITSDSAEIKFSPVAANFRDRLNKLTAVIVMKAQASEIPFYVEVANTVPEVLSGDFVLLQEVILSVVGDALEALTVSESVSLRVDLEGVQGTDIRLRFLILFSDIEDPSRIGACYLDKPLVGDRKFPISTGKYERVLQILDRLKGEHWVQILPDDSVTVNFTACFEIARSIEDDESWQDQKSDDAQNGLHVLLVEDDRVNQKIAIGLLKRLGHQVNVAGNGEEGLSVLKGGTFDVALVDVQMPVMDGFQFTAAVREEEKNSGRHLPIVALTAHAQEGDREKCLSAGLDDYLPKPFSKRELESILARVVNLEFAS